MGNSFTHYWQNDTWSSHAEANSGHPLRHTAGNDFARRGIAEGDTVYVITNLRGEMYVAGRMVVDRIAGRRDAERLLGQPLWDAEQHLIGREGTPQRFDLHVPRVTVRRLRFGEAEAPLKFAVDGG